MAQPDFSPSAERNKQPILELLRAAVPAQGEALEIASGTGQHVAWFAKHMPLWNWQPTDLQQGALYSVEAYVDQEGLTNVYAPMVLNVQSESWLDGAQTVDLVVCINMLHIAPWATCAALMRGCARHLAPGGKLVTYGPYIEDGVPTAASNLAFDASLRAHDPSYGIRRREDVAQAAQQAGLRLAARHAMAANNLLLVFERTGA
jgi:cyclopropane fatty-acyl-phospholipid synthase-like methyltransferase